MNHDDIDDLDRALFALPLEEPPAGMREAILRATAYAPALAPAPFLTVEVIGIGVTLALAVWLTIWSATNPHVASAWAGSLGTFVRAIAEPQTVVWLGVGGLTALWLTIAGASPLRLPFRDGRAS